MPRPWDDRVLKNAGRPFRSVEAFHNRWRAKIIVRLVERDRYGTDRHKKTLNLGIIKSTKSLSEIRGMLKKSASGVLAIVPCSRTKSTLRASNNGCPLRDAASTNETPSRTW